MSSQASPPAAPAISARRARTRQRIIDAAIQTVSERGFQATSLDEIAARAGLTKGAIYDNFESKDALFMASVRTASANRADRFQWPSGREGAVKARLRRLADAVIADAEAARADAPLRAELLLYVLTHEEVRQQMAAFAVPRMAYLEARLLELFAPEEMPVAPDKFAIMLEAMIPGLMFIRAQAPGLITDDAIRAVFEGLARD